MLCRYLLAYMAMCVNVLQAAVAGHGVIIIRVARIIAVNYSRLFPAVDCASQMWTHLLELGYFYLYG